MPRLSVIMPVWNGAAHLREAVDSILGQTFTDFEFLILDDGSNDGTPLILADYAERDSRVRVINLPHEGIVVALNRGVSEARSEWIARMDCDDISHPKRLEMQMAALGNNIEAVLCHTAIRQIGDPLYRTSLQRFPNSSALLAARLCYQSPIVHPTVIFSKDTFFKAGGFLPEERHAEDYSLWGRMLPLGQFIGIPEPLLDFRVHGGSISKQKADVQENLTIQIARRHCRDFMRLSEPMAERAHSAICYSRRGNGLLDWFWFLFRCLPRLRWQSAELWAWACSQSLRRLAR